MVDRVVAYEKGVSMTAIKNVTINEPFFVGHFPQLPTMPGVLILEAMAQTSGLLTAQETGLRPSSGVMFYFAGIDNARFRRIVVPGDQLMLVSKLGKVKRNLWTFTTEATVDGETACEAEILCVFKDAPPPPGTEKKPA
jgi:3-hydroxyacyl-[acyl-carrier-protein] dehydratase